MKIHLNDEYPNVVKCKKVPTKVHKLFINKLQEAKEDTIKKKRAKEEYCMATQEPVYDYYEGHNDEIDPNLIASIPVSLEHQHMYNEAIRHRHPNSQ